MHVDFEVLNIAIINNQYYIYTQNISFFHFGKSWLFCILFKSNGKNNVNRKIEIVRELL
jgi:hypothetical protein